MTLRKVGKQVKTGESSLQPQSGDQPLHKSQFGPPEAGEEASKTTAGPVPPIPTRIITHNIRYATTAPFKGEERWPIRCPRLCAELVFNSILPSTFICLQEVLREQLLDIRDHLNESKEGEWAYIGVGRDDGRESGEYSPIFYRPSVWKLHHWQTVWLSETPNVPSKGWDATSFRIATIGQFIEPKHGQRIIVASTHFDNDGPRSRKESAKLLPSILEKYSNDWGVDAMFLAGDLNSPPGDEAYKIIAASDSKLLDVRDLVPEKNRYGNEVTFTGFGHSDELERIDFIFTRKANVQGNPGDLEFKSYAVLANRYDDGVYSSDHRAVVADFILAPEWT